MRVIAFNPRQVGHATSATELTVELQRRVDLEGCEPTDTVAAFVDAQTSPARQLSLRLA